MSDGLLVCVCFLQPRGDTCINVYYYYSSHLNIITMPVYIIDSFNQVNDLMVLLTQDYLQEIKIHVCKMRHRDVYCSQYSQMMHDGQHPLISIVYVADQLEWSVRFVINQMIDNLPRFGDNNDEEFIMTCPGCGVPYSQQ